MSPRPTPAERKEQIITAAMSIFAEKGFNEATMDDIVAATGLSKGGLYWHFKSKDDIIQAILGQFFDEEMALLQMALNTPGSVVSRLRGLIDAIIAELNVLEMLLPVTYEFYAIAGRDANTRAVLRDYFDRYQSILADLLAEGVAAGELRPVDVAGVAMSFIAQMEGIILLWSFMEGNLDLPAQLHLSLNIMLDGLRPQGAPPEE